MEFVSHDRRHGSAVLDEANEAARFGVGLARCQPARQSRLSRSDTAQAEPAPRDIRAHHRILCVRK